MNTEVTIDVDDIMVGDPLDWSVLLVDLKKRICNYLDDCLVSLYEYLFIRIGLWFPFFDFEMVVLKQLKVSPSPLHLGAYA